MSAIERLQELDKNFAAMAEVMPETMGNFKSLKELIMPDQRLTKREKTLAALAIAVSKQCQDCIVNWVQSAIDEGLTLEEVIELCGVVMLLNGGPGAAYATQAVKVYRELAEQ